MGDIVVAADKLRGFAEKIFSAAGFNATEAGSMARSLTEAEMMGHGSHGLMRVISYVRDLQKGEVVATGAKLKVLQETPSSIAADAGLGVGQVVMPAILERLYAKLESQPVVSAAIRNCGHTGRIGEWVEGAAHKGFAALLMINDNGMAPIVAPPGGKRAVTSTNPVAFAVPLAGGEIYAADMSTSAVAFGKVKLARLNGVLMPPGSIQDAEGKPATDPNVMFADPPGSILPMGGEQGYKGFALSILIDMLVAGLSGGFAPPAPLGSAYANNALLVLWNPKFFSGLPHMQEEATKYAGFIRACLPSDPQKPIRLPGDRMSASKRDREKNGVPLSSDLAVKLINLAGELGVAPPPELTRR